MDPSVFADTTSSSLALARSLMDEFLDRTAPDGDHGPRRYLWTDAFAVCNLLGFHRASGRADDVARAVALVADVHETLGKHRDDDTRDGWLSGLSDDQGARHPTRGGLRIGKPLPERGPNELFDSRLEWERDGQYFHYLTQWMHALARIGEETERATFVEWAIELAQAAHTAFVRTDAQTGEPRLVWKMSVDLQRVLVPSTGQHDALEAWLAYLELDAAAERVGATARDLDHEIAEAETLLRPDWATNDPLGTGALLLAGHRLARLAAQGHDVDDVLARVWDDAAISLEAVARSGALAGSPEHRLAFREIGLAIGLHAVESLLRGSSRAYEVAPRALAAIARHLPVASKLDDFWSDPDHRLTRTWREHADIDDVMLATSLAPAGYLGGAW